MASNFDSPDDNCPGVFPRISSSGEKTVRRFSLTKDNLADFINGNVEGMSPKFKTKDGCLRNADTESTFIASDGLTFSMCSGSPSFGRGLSPLSSPQTRGGTIRREDRAKTLLRLLSRDTVNKDGGSDDTLDTFDTMFDTMNMDYDTLYNSNDAGRSTVHSIDVGRSVSEPAVYAGRAPDRDSFCSPMVLPSSACARREVIPIDTLLSGDYKQNDISMRTRSTMATEYAESDEKSQSSGTSDSTPGDKKLEQCTKKLVRILNSRASTRGSDVDSQLDSQDDDDDLSDDDDNDVKKSANRVQDEGEGSGVNINKNKQAQHQQYNSPENICQAHDEVEKKEEKVPSSPGSFVTLRKKLSNRSLSRSCLTSSCGSSAENDDHDSHSHIIENFVRMNTKQSTLSAPPSPSVMPSPSPSSPPSPASERNFAHKMFKQLPPPAAPPSPSVVSPSPSPSSPTVRERNFAHKMFKQLPPPAALPSSFVTPSPPCSPLFGKHKSVPTGTQNFEAKKVVTDLGFPSGVELEQSSLKSGVPRTHSSISWADARPKGPFIPVFIRKSRLDQIGQASAKAPSGRPVMKIGGRPVIMTVPRANTWGALRAPRPTPVFNLSKEGENHGRQTNNDDKEDTNGHPPAGVVTRDDYDVAKAAYEQEKKNLKKQNKLKNKKKECATTPTEKEKEEKEEDEIKSNKSYFYDLNDIDDGEESMTVKRVTTWGGHTSPASSPILRRANTWASLPPHRPPPGLSLSWEEDDAQGEEDEAGAGCRESSENGWKKRAEVSMACELSKSAEVTTLMLRNIPRRTGREDLVERLTNTGFAPGSHFDFLYLPFSLKTGQNYGHCFLNLTSTALVPLFQEKWHKLKFRPESKCINVSVAQVQGKALNLKIAQRDHKKRKVIDARMQPVVFENV